MNITPFENLNITTMTLVMSLTGDINIEKAFHLLPITRINIQQTRESAKCKLPHCKIPGSILSMRYRGKIRGVIKNKLSPFKNAITIDISTVKKNISLKLSSFSIQMCGASSRDDGIEAANHVLNHLKRIDCYLNKIRENPNQYHEIVDWVKENTRGEYVAFEIVEELKSEGNASLFVKDIREDNYIVSPKYYPPSHFDIEMVNFVLSLCGDFLYHSDMCKKLDFIPKIDKLISYPLEINNVDEAMVNYNFNLGFEIDRTKLNQLTDGRNGFVSRYNNALSNSVTLELPYEPMENKTIKRKKNKVPHMTFLCYKSGSVTLSGPGGEIMKIAYNLFMNTVSELKSCIEYNVKNNCVQV